MSAEKEESPRAGTQEATEGEQQRDAPEDDVQQTREHRAPRRKSHWCISWASHQAEGGLEQLDTEKQGVGKEGGDDELN